jgi:hypothetical protein
MDAIPWTVITSEDAEPAVPRAGCFAAVEAPDGSAEEETTTAPVFTAVIFPSIEDRDVLPVSCFALVAAPVGSGREDASTVIEPPLSSTEITPVESLAIVTRCAAASVPPPMMMGLYAKVNWGNYITNH